MHQETTLSFVLLLKHRPTSKNNTESHWGFRNSHKTFLIVSLHLLTTHDHDDCVPTSVPTSVPTRSTGDLLAQNKHVFIGIVLLQVLFQCISDLVIASARDPTTSSDALVAAVPPLLISCHLFFDVYGIVLGVFLGKQVVVLVVYQRARAKKTRLTTGWYQSK